MSKVTLEIFKHTLLCLNTITIVTRHSVMSPSKFLKIYIVSSAPVCSIIAKTKHDPLRVFVECRYCLKSVKTICIFILLLP